MKRPIAIAAIVVAAVVIGCGASSGPVTEGSTIDGWSVGAAYTCVDTDPERPCSALLPFAQKRLDQRDPGHVPVITSELRSQGPNHPTHTGIYYIALFTLADGSHKAIAVTYPEVATYLWTKDYGP
jgi:hypothetical protein